jgi:hypothetical protein
VIVTVTVPRAALAVAENDTVTVQVGLHGLFVKIAVTPVGKPDPLNITGVVVPLTRVASIDDDELVEPWTTLKLLGDGVERLKSKPADVTPRLNVLLLPEWAVSPG